MVYITVIAILIQLAIVIYIFHSIDTLDARLKRLESQIKRMNKTKD